MSDWYGVDLDGTLARSHPADVVPNDFVGTPIAPMVARVKRWLSEGKDVRIFTARDAQAYPAIRKWCMKHLGKTIKITNKKDRDMVELWDDRAVQVEHNTGRRM